MSLHAAREALHRRARAGDDSGFTLVEMLVAMILLSALGATLLTAVMAAANASQANRTYNDLNEEARLVLNRMSRELREATAITAVQNPTGPGYSSTADTSVTLTVDFNGNGTIEPAAADPEQITYTYDRAARQLKLSAGGTTVPVLAGDVESFALTFRARLTDRRLSLDGLSTCNTPGATKDGLLDWIELDRGAASGLGNCNGVLDAELKYIDSVQIDLTVLKDPRSQRYRTQVDLRNVTE